MSSGSAPLRAGRRRTIGCRPDALTAAEARRPACASTDSRSQCARHPCRAVSPPRRRGGALRATSRFGVLTGSASGCARTSAA